jgi:nickel/cobalt exporter
MQEIIIGTILLSLLHAVIPSHWLPVLTVGNTLQWSIGQVTRVTFITASAHVISTIGLGILVAKMGWLYSKQYQIFAPYVAPGILIVMGLLIIGLDFHNLAFLKGSRIENKKSKAGIIAALMMVMFFSPCLEIEGYFLLAGTKGWWLIAVLSAIYAIITITGMLIWVRLMFKGLLSINWPQWEFNSSIITGMILVATGMLIFII